MKIDYGQSELPHVSCERLRWLRRDPSSWAGDPHLPPLSTGRVSRNSHNQRRPQSQCRGLLSRALHRKEGKRIVHKGIILRLLVAYTVVSSWLLEKLSSSMCVISLLVTLLQGYCEREYIPTVPRGGS